VPEEGTVPVLVDVVLLLGLPPGATFTPDVVVVFPTIPPVCTRPMISLIVFAVAVTLVVWLIVFAEEMHR
jgi:hypothetical protein